MGGTIWVESNLGQGSTFHFTMLLPWADEAPPHSPRAAGHAPDAAPQPLPSSPPQHCAHTHPAVLFLHPSAPVNASASMLLWEENIPKCTVVLACTLPCHSDFMKEPLEQAPEKRSW